MKAFIKNNTNVTEEMSLSPGFEVERMKSMNMKSDATLRDQDSSQGLKASAFKATLQESDHKNLMSIAESSIVNIAERAPNTMEDRVQNTQSSQERIFIYADKVLDT